MKIGFYQRNIAPVQGGATQAYDYFLLDREDGTTIIDHPATQDDINNWPDEWNSYQRQKIAASEPQVTGANINAEGPSDATVESTDNPVEQ